MRNYLLLIVFAAIASACGSPAANNNNLANTNTPVVATNSNVASVTPAAPTKEALLELDKKANEAWIKRDAKFFDDILSDKYVSFLGGKRTSKGDELRMIAATACEVTKWDVTEPQLTMIDADTAALIYTSTVDGTCGGQKIPSPNRAATIWVREADKWRSVYHNETPILDAKLPPAPKKPEPKKPPVKLPPGKPANGGTPDAKPVVVPDALTETLMAVEKGGWEAFKARDAAKLGDFITKNMANVGPDGLVSMGSEAVIKAWVGPKCEIKSVSIGEGTATTISDTVAILTYKGNADGTCEGNPLGSLYATSIYVKQGEAWKLAFGFETLAN